MKRIVILTLAALLSVGLASAQNYMVIDSEKVFKSIKAYNEALNSIDTLSEQYQKQVDAKFREVESMYNSYMQQRASLSEGTRQQYEQRILQKEAEATKYQESIFGSEGELMKRRVELIQPIQERVFSTIESFAKQYGYDLVIDIAANPTVLYYSERVNCTEQIIRALQN